MVSHDLHVVMAASDRVICLNGHVCCEGTPQVVSTAPEYRALFGLGTQGALALYRHTTTTRMTAQMARRPITATTMGMATGIRMVTGIPTIMAIPTITGIPTTRGARIMLDDFLLRAALAGVGLSLATGPLGAFVVWRRMAYFGDATAHAAILGVALALATDLPVAAGTLVVAAAMAVTVAGLAARGWAMDTTLGVLAHSALAFGLVAVSYFPGVRTDLSAYLFGDILAVGRGDLALIWGGAVLVLGADRLALAGAGDGHGERGSGLCLGHPAGPRAAGAGAGAGHRGGGGAEGGGGAADLGPADHPGGRGRAAGAQPRGHGAGGDGGRGGGKPSGAAAGAVAGYAGRSLDHRRGGGCLCPGRGFWPYAPRLTAGRRRAPARGQWQRRAAPPPRKARPARRTRMPSPPVAANRACIACAMSLFDARCRAGLPGSAGEWHIWANPDLAESSP
jgi:hypothetical protein